ncbi:MAG TPA: three-Cys-motif partner protein TcmP [Cyclobacteriaceae bacterium]|nr:three-Cys-motif partner protein TcmP [Cyclobacteriaceae bacterium]HNE05230.1 three-Cys-motif partner protein TcmP [Anaerolineales bacterium]
MTKPNETLWEIEPHTKAKHDILQNYLGAWFGILGSKIPKIVYIDGFCGPGRYKGGEEGSPIIAVKEAMKHLSLLAQSNVTFLFIDERQDRIEHLKSELASLNPPGNFHLDPRVNEFENTLTQILDGLAQSGRQLAPTFAFIDPFGFKGASFSVTRRLLNNKSTEVFINIMVNFVNRFAKHPDATDRAHIKSLLGATDAEIDEVVSSPDRIEGFRQLYQSKLRQYARFVRFFEMRDQNNKVIYYLFFAGNHPKGHEKMKEAFWRVDRQNGYKFSDRTDPNQPVLFEMDPSLELARILKTQYSGMNKLSQDVITFVVDETAYISTHCRRALAHLENNSEIRVESNKVDGKKRIKGTFPPGVVIHF